MTGEKIDILSACVNANFVADSLDEFAENKEQVAKNGHPFWYRKLVRWAENERSAAKTIRNLMAAIEQLRSEANR